MYVVGRGLGKSYGEKPILQNVDFAVEPGEIVGVLGENGAGKTTLLEMVLGYTPPTAGSVKVFGYESRSLPGAEKRRIGFVPQVDELIGHLTVSDHIRLIGSFYEHWDDNLTSGLIGAWGIDRSARIKTLSVGQRQKLSIILSLGHRPDLLILDEPVASLDPIARRYFLAQMVEITAEQNRSVIFSSHIVSDIERLSDKIWIVKDRGLLWAGNTDELRDSVVRLHFRDGEPPELIRSSSNLIHVSTSPDVTTVVVGSWNDDLAEAVLVDGSEAVELERLTLEDIFLELHR